MRILLIGNCQADVIADLLSVMRPDIECVTSRYKFISPEKIAASDLIFASDRIPDLDSLLRSSGVHFQYFPQIYFTGFHPDAVLSPHGPNRVLGPMGPMHSNIVISAFKAGKTAKEARALFCKSTFRDLGYFEYWSNAVTLNRTAFDECNMQWKMHEWRSSGPFMYQPVHPRLFVLADIARQLLALSGITPSNTTPELHCADALHNAPIWPVYPEIGEAIGMTGNYWFKPKSTAVENRYRPKCLSLAEFIERSYEIYSTVGAPVVEPYDIELQERLRLDYSRGSKVVCDEELLDQG